MEVLLAAYYDCDWTLQQHAAPKGPGSPQFRSSSQVIVHRVGASDTAEKKRYSRFMISAQGATSLFEQKPLKFLTLIKASSLHSLEIWVASRPFSCVLLRN